MKTIASFCIALLLLTGSVGAADLSFTPATYNEWGEPVAGAGGYQPSRTVDGNTLGTGAWSAPADMAVSPDGNTLFVLDAGNNRVTVCGRDFKNARSVAEFTGADGVTRLNGATGLFFDGTSLYIADKGNARVIRCDTAGNISRVFEKPDSPLFPQEKQYLPTRVAADGNGVLYVICEGIDQGAVMYSPDGAFLGYIGSNKVQATLAVLFNSLIKKLVSQEAQENMAKYTPVEFNNLTIDRENFLYTCTDVQDVREKIKKLGAGGVNILAAKVKNSFQKGFGDIKPPYVDGTTAHSRFVDIAVDQAGCFYGLDFTNMRVFAYDPDANLLFTFGGPGTQAGLFRSPVAVEVMDDSVLVLDTSACQITCFEKTEFGSLVDTAMDLYRQGRYGESVRPWNEVLKYNSNFTRAYIGLGKAQLELGNVAEALENFKTAHYEAGYNEAYRILRVDGMRSGFPLYFAALLLLLFLIYGRQIPFVRRLFSRAARGFRPSAKPEGRRFRTPLYAILHPVEGFQEMRYQKAGSLGISTLLVLLFFFALFARERLFGFAFRVDVNPEDLNLPLLFALSAGLCLLFTAINWGICTLFDGSGRLKDIWTTVGYSLAPYVISVLLAAALSRFLTSEEAVFISALQSIGAIYSVFLLIKGIEAYHEYSFRGAVVSVAFTLVGILLTVLLGILLFSIAQQFIAFFVTTYQEMSLRMR